MTRHVVITGAARGIGADTLRLLKARGDRVTALDLSQVEGADRWIKVDLSDPADILRACDEIDGSVDVLICNAGLPPLADNALGVLSVNVLSVTAVAKALSDRMNSGGAIVVTASRAGADWQDHIEEIREVLAAETPEDLSAFLIAKAMDPVRAYRLSKEAMIYWVKGQVNGLLASKIRINSVSPAPVATGILDDFVDAFGAKATAALKRVGRAAEPLEVAQAIVFLASEQASWINGHDLIVDGGLAGLQDVEGLT